MHVDGVPPREVRAAINDIIILACKTSFSFAAVRRHAKQVANCVGKLALSVGSWIYSLGSCLPNSFSVLVCKNRSG